MKSSVLWRADVWLKGLKLRTQVVAGSILTVSTVCAMAGVDRNIIAEAAANKRFLDMRIPLFLLIKYGQLTSAPANMPSTSACTAFTSTFSDPRRALAAAIRRAASSVSGCDAFA